jgi:hypothetical protein
MRLEATFSTADLRNALCQLTPLTISLDPDSPHRRLSIKPPSEVALIAGLGLRVVAEVQLQWDVIGVRLPVTLRRVAIVLDPSVMLLDGQEALAFTLRLEEADLSAIPSFLQDVLVARLNEALARPEARIAWRFLDTLDFRFDLPPAVQPRIEARLYARSGTVSVRDDELHLSVEWGFAAEPDTRGDVPPFGA